jgi:hypothetical protein
MNYETFVEAPKTDSDSEHEILELTLDEQHYVAGGFLKMHGLSFSFGASNAAPGTSGSGYR